MLYTSPWSRFELITSVVIGTDCIGSCKSNYHAITARTAPITLYCIEYTKVTSSAKFKLSLYVVFCLFIGVVRFTTTYAIGAYHHWCYEFESRSGRGVQHYVIECVSDLRQVGGFLVVKWQMFEKWKTNGGIIGSKAISCCNGV
jgi:hypothetical protein